MRRKLLSLPIAIMAAAFVLFPVLPSEASFIVELCGNFQCNDEMEIVDGGPGDFNLAPGIIDFLFFPSSFQGFVSGTASSKPARAEPSMAVDFMVFRLFPDETRLSIFAWDTDFTTIAPLSGHLFGESTDSGSTRGSIFGGVDNTQYTIDNPTRTPFVSFGGDFNTFDATVLHPASIADPYSMGLAVRIDFPDNLGGMTNGTFEVRPVAEPEPSTVPEPASLILFGTGVAGWVAQRRRKKLQA